MEEQKLSPMHESLNHFEKWRENSFMRYRAKTTEDNNLAELGINGFGNISIHINGAEYKTFIQPYKAIEEFVKL